MAGIEADADKDSRNEVIPLTQNCLECVTNNFGRYNEAFLSSEDCIMQQNLLFLQLTYTPVLIKNLGRKGMLCDEYLEFLINDNVKELDIGNLIENRCSCRAIDDRIAAVGHVFEKVFYGLERQANIFEFPFQATLCHLKRVEVLHIPHHCNDTILQHISTFCPNLIELNIDCSKNVTEKGLELLCIKNKKHPECLIKVLSMKLINVLDPAIIKFLLTNMPYLAILEYTYVPFILYSMHEKDLKNNTLKNVKHYNLTKLDFSYVFRRASSCLNTYAKVLKVWAEVCPNITTLTLFLFTRQNLDMIYSFLNLKNLTVVGNDFGPNILFQSLNTIPAKQKLCNTKLSSLMELCWQDINFSKQFGLEYLKEILRNSPNLKKISFDHCQFKNCDIRTALAEYCEHCTLECLQFSYCDIKLSLLETILNCQTLVSLTIDSCKYISPHVVYNLQSLAHSSGSFVKITSKANEGFVYEHETNDDSNYETNYYDDFDSDESYSDVYIPGSDDDFEYEFYGATGVGWDSFW